MKPVVDAFAFTLSFPVADEEYIMLVYDALKEHEDSSFRVEMDVDGRIHVAVRPVYSVESAVDEFPNRVAGYADLVRKRVNDAVAVADRRYQLLRELDRIERALSDSRRADILAEMIPSVW